MGCRRSGEGRGQSARCTPRASNVFLRCGKRHHDTYSHMKADERAVVLFMHGGRMVIFESNEPESNESKNKMILRYHAYTKLMHLIKPLRLWTTICESKKELSHAVSRGKSATYATPHSAPFVAERNVRRENWFYSAASLQSPLYSCLGLPYKCVYVTLRKEN